MIVNILGAIANLTSLILWLPLDKRINEENVL